MDKIFLKVISQDGNEVRFQIKRSSQIRKLMIVYCHLQGVGINSIRFFFHGKRLREEKTPDELEMENGDMIDAMMFQIGGCITLTAG